MSERLLAPAKLTWYLEVTARRSDGYHLLRSEMLTLDTSDVLTFSTGSAVSFSGSRPNIETLDATDNLVTKALALVGRTAHVHVEKNIPLGGGLGGGSADAAAVLRWAGFRDLERAATLGGDVPFCLVGGRAVVTGIGERVEPLAFESRTVTLFLPDFGVNTARCYQAFDELTLDGAPRNERNHLTDAAIKVEPRLGELMRWIDATYGPAILAGSGSTVYVEGDVTGGATGVVESPVGPVEVIVSHATPA